MKNMGMFGFLGIVMASTAAQAMPLGPVLNCNAFWAAFTGTFYCREVTNFQDMIQGKKARFFRHNDGATDVPGAQESYVEWTKQAVRDSYAVFATFGKVTDVSFVLLKDSHPDTNANYTIYAEARPLKQGATESCPVSIYSDAMSLSEARFKQLISHELYHCFQGANFKPQLSCADGGTPAACDKAVGWWAEGSADYFSNLVYPGANVEWSHVTSYESMKAVHRQPYPYAAAAFFQGLANHAPDHEKAVHRLLKNMAKTADPADHQKALSAQPLMAENLHGFAQDLLGGEIQDTGIGKLPVAFNGALDEIKLKLGMTSVTLDAIPYTARTASLMVPAGHKVTFKRFDGMSQQDPYARASVRRAGSSVWKDLSYLTVEEDMSCQDADTSVEVVLTSARSSEDPIDLSIEFEIETKPCGCKETDYLDPCVVGSWRLANDIFAQGASHLPSGTKYLSTTGGLVMTLKQNKSIQMDFANLTPSYEITQETVGKMLMETAFSGTLKARVGVTPDHAVCLKNIDDQSVLTTTITFAGGEKVENKTSDNFSGGGDSKSHVSCSEDTLIIRSDAQGGDGAPITYNAIFSRISH